MSGRTLSRRELLGGAAAALLAAGAARALSAAEDDPRASRRPKGLKISCSSLAFSDLKWDEALREIRKLGFRYADLAMFEGWCHVSPSRLEDPEGHGGAIAKACAEIEVEPICIHASFAPDPEKRGAFPGLTSPDAAARKLVLEHFDRVARCARGAGVPLVNVQPGRFIAGRPREECLRSAIDLLRPMQEAAAKRGLVLSFENHTGSIGERPEDALQLIEAVPGLKIDYDFSHVVACAIPVEKTAPLLRHAVHCGIRNAREKGFNEPVRDGKLDYDLGAFLDALRAAKADAFVSIEYFQPEMRGQIPALKRILEDAGLSAER